MIDKLNQSLIQHRTTQTSSMEAVSHASQGADRVFDTLTGS